MNWFHGEPSVGMPHSYGWPFTGFGFDLVKILATAMPIAEKATAAMIRTINDAERWVR